VNPDATSLDRLHDIVQAPDVPWWPPAPGWFWLAGGLIILLVLIGVYALLRWQKNCYRREGLAEIDRMEAVVSQPARRTSVVIALNELLKRGALSVWPRDQVASLTGPLWIDFLNRTRGQKQSLRLDPETFSRAPYDERFAAGLSEQKVRDLALSARAWFKHHRVETKESQQP
jgi:Domain of unknown function (DUF4381)